MSSESGEQYIAVDEEMYVVEAIRGKRMIGNSPQYLVKWLNWDRPEDLTWEPLENLTTVKDLVEIFESKKNRKEVSEESKLKEDQLKSEAKRDVMKQKKLIKESDKKKREERREEERKKEKSKIKSEHRKNKQIEILSSDSESESESPEPEKNSKADIRIGQINHLLVNEKGEKNYEVDMINKKGECVGIKLVTSKFIKAHEKHLLVQFLEGYLLDEEKWIANKAN